MPNVNGQIKAREVDLVDAEGVLHKSISIYDALSIAEKSGLDVVEVSPKVNPPVCKVMDFGKYKYEEQKKHATSSHFVRKIKETKMGVNISPHDLDVKVNKSIEFLKEGHNVKFVVQMRGREMAHKNIAIDLMNKIVAVVELHAKMQEKPKLIGNQVFVMFSSEKVMPKK